MARYLSALFCGITLLYAQTYIFSYKAQVKNATLIHESLYVSAVMTQGHHKKVWEETLLLDKTCSKDFFNCYKEELVDMLFRQNVKVQSIETKSRYDIKSFSELLIAPLYFEVNFYDTFVKIALLK